MVELIVLIIFVISLGGIFFMLARKAPQLAKLPQDGSTGLKKPELIEKIHTKIKHHHFHLFEKQMLLHKILSFVKILTLKMETKIDTLLHGIRKKAQDLDKKTKEE